MSSIIPLLYHNPVNCMISEPINHTSLSKYLSNHGSRWWGSYVSFLVFSSPEHEVLSELLWSFNARRSSFVRPSVRPSDRQQFLKTFPLKPLIGFWPNYTGMIHGWSSIKVVQPVPVGCINRSRGKKIGFQNAIFKKFLVLNHKAQSFYIWYIASSRGPLSKLFKLCPWGQNWPRPGGSRFYIELYKEKFKRLLLLNP